MWDDGSVNATLFGDSATEGKPVRACVLHVNTQTSDENGCGMMEFRFTCVVDGT